MKGDVFLGGNLLRMEAMDALTSGESLNLSMFQLYRPGVFSYEQLKHPRRKFALRPLFQHCRLA